MMSAYKTIISELATLDRNSDLDNEARVATASAVYGMVHLGLAALAHNLGHEGFDIQLYEHTASVELRFGGSSLGIRRLNNQCRLTITACGFHEHIVKPELSTQVQDVGVLSLDECQAFATTFCRTLGEVLRAEHLKRTAS